MPGNREKTMRSIGADILKRDQDSLRRGFDYVPTVSMGEVRAGRTPTKLEAMEYMDAYRRRTKAGDVYPLPKEIERLARQGDAEARSARKQGYKKGGSVKAAPAKAKAPAMKKPAYKMGGCVRGKANKAVLYKAVKGK